MSNAIDTILSASAILGGYGFLTFYSAEIVNAKRDAIVLGMINGVRISGKHRRVMLSNDWVPMKFSLAAFSVVGAIALFMVGADSEAAPAKAFSQIAALFPCFGALTFLFLGVVDLLFCIRSLRDAED